MLPILFDMESYYYSSLAHELNYFSCLYSGVAQGHYDPHYMSCTYERKSPHVSLFALHFYSIHSLLSPDCTVAPQPSGGRAVLTAGSVLNTAREGLDVK